MIPADVVRAVHPNPERAIYITWLMGELFLADVQGEQVLPLSDAHVAEHTGLSPRTVTRCRRWWAERGVVACHVAGLPPTVHYEVQETIRTWIDWCYEHGISPTYPIDIRLGIRHE